MGNYEILQSRRHFNKNRKKISRFDSNRKGKNKSIRNVSSNETGERNAGILDIKKRKQI